jgi:coenzyme PQQ precursor peptide PqqA
LRYQQLRQVIRTPIICGAKGAREKAPQSVEDIMAWTTPTLVEICIGLEINGYLPAEF